METEKSIYNIALISFLCFLLIYVEFGSKSTKSNILEKHKEDRLKFHKYLPERLGSKATVNM